jgi:hypothetical protein
MMRQSAYLLAVMMSGALTGCLGGLGGSGGSGGIDGGGDSEIVGPGGRMPVVAERVGPEGLSKKAKSYRLITTLNLATIEVPIGTASGSEEIWSYLDEEPVKATRSASLGRNGIRVGLGRGDSWPDLKRIFQRMTGRSLTQSRVASTPGNPLPIVLKEHLGVQTIFTFHDDRTLSGRDHPPGDNMLTVVCTLDADDPSRVLLTAVPQIRSSRKKTRFVLGGAGPSLQAAAEVHSFAHLTFQLMVPREGFVVIGPGMAARNPTSVGHHFLVKEREGVQFETVVVLTPEVFAAPINK